MNNELINMTEYIKSTFALEQMFLTDRDILDIINHEKKGSQNDTKRNIYATWEDYLIDGTTVLKNIPNIQDQDDLISFERISSANRLAELYKEPISNNFDTEHLCQIHRYLFQDIYDWAGELRNVHMMKQATVFLEPNKIENYLELVFEEAKKDLANVQNKYDLSACLANLFYCLIFAHPFREGNGRTIREFLRQLVNSLNLEFGSFDIDYSKIDQTNLAMGLTCAATMFITNEFNKALIERNNQNKILQYK